MSQSVGTSGFFSGISECPESGFTLSAISMGVTVIAMIVAQALGDMGTKVAIMGGVITVAPMAPLYVIIPFAITAILIVGTVISGIRSMR